MARRVVELAAIAGQSVELRVLEPGPRPARTGDVGAGLDELVEAKLLTEVGGVRPAYQFAHAIVHDTVEASVPVLGPGPACTGGWPRPTRPPTRPTGGRCWPSWPVTSRARRPLGTSAKAVYYLRRAASQALRSVAYEEAIGHLEVALQLDPAGGGPGRHPARPG